MVSPAIKAQGTTFEIETGTGAGKTITGVTLGAITEVLSTAHALSKGDVVTFSAVGGTTELNGVTAMIIATETGSMFFDIDSSGYGAWTSGGTATPVTYTQILGVKSFSKSGGGASE